MLNWALSFCLKREKSVCLDLTAVEGNSVKTEILSPQSLRYLIFTWLLFLLLLVIMVIVIAKTYMPWLILVSFYSLSSRILAIYMWGRLYYPHVKRKMRPWMILKLAQGLLYFKEGFELNCLAFEAGSFAYCPINVHKWSRWSRQQCYALSFAWVRY